MKCFYCDKEAVGMVVDDMFQTRNEGKLIGIGGLTFKGTCRKHYQIENDNIKKELEKEIYEK